MGDIALTLSDKRWTYREQARVILNGERVDGSCDWETRTIRVDKTLGNN